MPGPGNDQLQKVIKDVVTRISRYRGSAFNEQDTKAALIKPILEALGWDTSDPEQVRHEFKTNPRDNPVDYALLHMRQPRLIVEAKGLGESLDDQRWVGQMLGYSAVGGALWCVLTNGDDYRIYNATAPVAAADKLLCKVRLSNDPIEQATLLLSLLARANVEEPVLDTLWKTQHIDRKVTTTLRELFATPDRRLVRLIRAAASGLSPRDVMNSLRRLSIRVEQPPLQFPNETTKPAIRPSPGPKGKKAAMARPKKAGKKVYGVELSELIASKLLMPPLRLYRRYRGKVMEARLLSDGRVEFQGQVFNTCSTAAEAARSTITGRRMNTNGWSFWQLDDGTGKPQTLEEVRAVYLARKGTE